MLPNSTQHGVLLLRQQVASKQHTTMATLMHIRILQSCIDKLIQRTNEKQLRWCGETHAKLREDRDPDAEFDKLDLLAHSLE